MPLYSRRKLIIKNLKYITMPSSKKNYRKRRMKSQVLSPAALADTSTDTRKETGDYDSLADTQREKGYGGSSMWGKAGKACQIPEKIGFHGMSVAAAYFPHPCFSPHGAGTDYCSGTVLKGWEEAVCWDLRVEIYRGWADPPTLSHIHAHTCTELTNHTLTI